jgi:hypothetical protein
MLYALPLILFDGMLSTPRNDTLAYWSLALAKVSFLNSSRMAYRSAILNPRSEPLTMRQFT